MVFTVQEAKTQLGKLLDLARSGEEVIITRHGKTVAKLVAAGDEARGKRGMDSMKGEISWQEGWERAMTDEEADAFLEGRY